MRILLVTLGLFLVTPVQAKEIVRWPMDQQAHFLAGYGIGMTGALVAERLELPLPWLWGLAAATGAAYAKERYDGVFSVPDFQKAVWGGATGCVFYAVIRL